MEANMENNCKICAIKKALTKNCKGSFSLDNDKKYENKVSFLPPMGWSSWNTFRNNIDETLILQTAEAMKDKGLLEAGYNYVNLDDCWQSSSRDSNGELQGDLVRFVSGIPSLVKKINALGFKAGIYSSNGTYTCEDLPASLNNEERDAETFAKWGIEYFKYDFCHNTPISYKAPLVYKIDIFSEGVLTEYPCGENNNFGNAYLKKHKKLGFYAKGLDKNNGYLEFDIESEKDKECVLTIHTKKHSRRDKFLIAEINREEKHYINIPPQVFFNLTYRHQVVINLKKGINTIKLYNPIKNKIYSSYYQYKKMSNALLSATEKTYNGKKAKPIMYSICEWGRNKPWLWGESVGNLWRTTLDIRPIWVWILHIYNKTIKLANYANKGAWNDPDMLEVGNGKLNYEQNKSHFSVWCMMNAPLILGNDIRKISEDTLKIVTNKNMISLNQDTLAIAGYKLVSGRVDVLVKLLSDGIALCFFNKTRSNKTKSYNLDSILESVYPLNANKNYVIKDMWENSVEDYSSKLNVKLKPYDCKVIKIFSK